MALGAGMFCKFLQSYLQVIAINGWVKLLIDDSVFFHELFNDDSSIHLKNTKKWWKVQLLSALNQNVGFLWFCKT